MRRLSLPGAVLLSLVALYLLLAGIQQFVIDVRYGEAKTLTYGDFTSLHPSNGWYHITDAGVWFTEYRGRVGPGRLTVVPLRDNHQPIGPIEIFLEPKNPKIIATMDALDALPPGAPRAAYLKAHPEQVNVNVEVEGGIVPTLDPSALNLNLAESAYGVSNIDKQHTVLMTEADGPSATRASVLVVCALVLGFFIYRWYAWSMDPYRESRIQDVMEQASEDPDRDARIRQVLQSSGVEPDRKPVDTPWWERPSEGGPRRDDKDAK